MIQIVKCRNGRCYETLVEENFEVIAHDIDGELVLDSGFEEE